VNRSSDSSEFDFKSKSMYHLIGCTIVFFYLPLFYPQKTLIPSRL